MRILTRKQQVKIAKHLAAIQYIVTDNFGGSREEQFLALEGIISNVADIAFEVGGINYMVNDVPAALNALKEAVEREQE